MPTGGQGSRSNLTGASVLGWDPDVEEAGVDTGFSPEEDMLRAPDVAIGNVPERRVEVHRLGAKVRIVQAGQELTAPGVLRNPVPVEALYDRQAAQQATLRNLLHREGYADLDAVRDEGKKLGLDEGKKLGAKSELRRSIAVLCRVLDIPYTPERQAAVDAMEHAQLVTTSAHIEAHRAWPDAAS